MSKHWNYRVLEDDHGMLAVHEVYYADDGAVEFFSVDPMAPHGQTLEELQQELERYSIALKKPVLHASDFAHFKSSSSREDPPEE